MHSFIHKMRRQYKAFLDDVNRPRAKSCEVITAYLELLEKPAYLLVETGCVRQDSWVDGRATVLFDQFLQVHDGRLFSVDIDAGRCAYARSQVSDKTTVVNEDSVSNAAKLSVTP